MTFSELLAPTSVTFVVELVLAPLPYDTSANCSGNNGAEIRRHRRAVGHHQAQILARSLSLKLVCSSFEKMPFLSEAKIVRYSPGSSWVLVWLGICHLVRSSASSVRYQPATSTVAHASVAQLDPVFAIAGKIGETIVILGQKLADHHGPHQPRFELLEGQFISPPRGVLPAARTAALVLPSHIVSP